MATWGQGISLKGAAGKDGLSVLFGSGAPANTLGVDGQTYISDTGDLYAKTSGSWVKQRSLVGPAGMNALNAQLLHGAGAPTTSTFANNVDAIYIQDGGEVWYFDFEGSKSWVDAGYSLRGQVGATGPTGDRGTYTYTGSGAPSSDLNSFSPGPARAGDLFYDIGTAGGPFLYVLGN